MRCSDEVLIASLAQAKVLIQEKMRGRLAGGPAELRRTFQYFDGDGGGTIDVEEFSDGLRMHCGLQFEPERLAELMWDYSGGKSHINFTDFVENVMDSRKDSGTSIGHYKKSTNAIANDDGNSEQVP